MRLSPSYILDTKWRLLPVTTLYVGMTVAAMMTLPIGAHAQAPAKINVTQRNYDTFRTGWNQQETTLDVANVGSSSFKQVAQVLNLDGQIDAQPLLVTGRSITGQNGTYDVLYVATENNTVYAFDASNGAILTQRNLGAPVKSSSLVGGKCKNASSRSRVGDD